VKFESTLERKLLEVLEEKDTGSGLAFSDHDAVKQTKLRNVIRDRLVQNEDYTAEIRYHFEIMERSGFVNFLQDSHNETVIQMTHAGHSRLDFIRDNTWRRRIVRSVVRWVDSAVTSIFTPIVVSILTILAINYLGINK